MQLAELLEKHRPLLEEAVQANAERSYYAHWPEIPSPKIYGESANEEGQAAFKARLEKAFEGLVQSGVHGEHGEEHSPYGFPLGISYPLYSAETLVAQAQDAAGGWRVLAPEVRAAVLIECLERAARHFFEIAYATMHTTGQGFMMAFQASGPHAFDRALEAVAQGYNEQGNFSPAVEWTKQVGKEEFVTIRKKFNIVPRGINLVVGCSTFPTWNSTPGIFAGLVTGNTVIVKPHPGAVLPAAILVASMQQTLQELGLNPHIVQLAADSSAAPIALQLAEHPAVKLIDYTGGSAFGNRLEKLAAESGKICFTEKAGVNPVIIESVDNLDKVLDNLAFSVSLYSGQMCTAPQNFFINKNGVKEGDTLIPYAEVKQRFTAKIKGLCGHPKIGAPTLGALQNPATAERVRTATELGAEVLLPSENVEQPGFPQARSMSPLVLEAAAGRNDLYGKELFGPIIFLIPCDSFTHSLDLLLEGLRTQGALTTLVYSTDEQQCNLAESRIVYEAGAPVAFNYVGNIWVNQSAAFSDFHGAGANPAGNASFTDGSFITNRYNLIGTRRLA